MNFGLNLMNLLSFLLIYCNIAKDSDADTTAVAPTQLVGNELASCPFCNVTTENGFRIIFENEQFVAFHDRSPSSFRHIQVVPKKHFAHIQSLRKDDVALLVSMEEIGHRILDDFGIPPSNRKLGFHIPPFFSVRHLHLHVLSLPYTHFIKRRKYPVVSGSKGYSKGFSWFVDVRQAIEILERGRRVEVWSC